MLRSMLKMRAAVLAGFIAGCSALPPQLQPESSIVDGIVDEAMVAARAPAAEQSAALARAEKAAASGMPVDRLRLATLLATLAPPSRDEVRAGELLRPLADASSPGIGRFASLLAAQLAERQRLARELERLSREAERSAREGEKREEALKQQIEALRAIERNILEPAESLRRRPR